MEILHIDIKPLRPNRLGCYGYHRHTALRNESQAASGFDFCNGLDSIAASGTPCLPVYEAS